MAAHAEHRSGPELIERAKALVPLVSSEAAASEELGEITATTMDALHDAELIGMWTPRNLGGSEIGFTDGGEVIEQIAYGDGSSGWVFFCAVAASAGSGAYYGDEAVAEMYSGERIPHVAGQGSRPGLGVRQDGGYGITGNWSFGSGIKHAQWTQNLVVVDGAPVLTTTRIEDAQLDRDSWQTIGLRATGSLDYTIEQVFVPESFTAAPSAASSTRGGPLYHSGQIGFITAGHGAWALGVGRRMLDELKANLAAKAGRAGAASESEAFLDGYEVAEARLRSARALFRETWQDVDATLDAGDDLSQEQISMQRMAVTNATWRAHEVATFVYLAGGTLSIRPGPVQRGFRDMQTGAQHVTASPMLRHNVARMLSGVAEGKSWDSFFLVDDETAPR